MDRLTDANELLDRTLDDPATRRQPARLRQSTTGSAV
jgi:hypothetical protein